MMICNFPLKILKRARNTVGRIVENEQFRPSSVGLLVNPFYFARKELHYAFSEFSKLFAGKILDVGCGLKPYRHLFFHVSQYIGLEIDTAHMRKFSKADIFYDGKKFPFKKNYFDGVFSSEVFEHVFDPANFIREINRVLKSGGLLLISVPFIWDEHETPNDFARYTSYGLRHILQQHGFSVLEHRKTNNDMRVIFQLLNDYIYKKTSRLRRGFYSELAVTMLLMAPFNIIGCLLAKIMPKNDDLYLDNVILAKKVTNVWKTVTAPRPA